LLAELPQHFKAVDPWQHDVEHYEFEVLVLGALQAVAAIVAKRHGDLFPLEELLQQRTEFGVIINHNYRHEINLARDMPATAPF
jgi:hypothetical protein